MKLSQKQEREVEIINYFIPENIKKEFTDNDIEEYFLKSEKGIGEMPEFMKIGKKWRDAHITMYKEDYEKVPITFFLWEAKEEFPKPVFEHICKSLVGFVPLKLK